MDDDYNIKLSILDHGLTYTFPQSRGANAPLTNFKTDPVVNKDVSFFYRNQDRRFDLRRTRSTEFEPSDNRKPPHPALWVFVINLYDRIIRIPIFRGKRPYETEPCSDAEVLKTVAECFSNQGIDREAMLGWLADLEAERWDQR